MSAAHNDVDEADRLARVKLSCGIEPGNLRVTALISALDAGVILEYLEEVADVAGHWATSSGQQLAHVDPAQILEQAGHRGIRFLVPGDTEWPDQVGALREAGALNDRGGEPVGPVVQGRRRSAPGDGQLGGGSGITSRDQARAAKGKICAALNPLVPLDRQLVPA